jgi:hypothetical protein
MRRAAIRTHRDYTSAVADTDYRYCPMCRAALDVAVRGGEPRLVCTECAFVHTMVVTGPLSMIIVAEAMRKVAAVMPTAEPALPPFPG